MRGSASVLGPARSSELDFAVGGRRAPDRRRPRVMGRGRDPRAGPDQRRGRNRVRLRLSGLRLGQAGSHDGRRICIRDAPRLKVTAGDQARGCCILLGRGAMERRPDDHDKPERCQTDRYPAHLAGVQQLAGWRPEADFALSNKSKYLADGATFTCPAKSLTFLGRKLHRGNRPQAPPGHEKGRPAVQRGEAGRDQGNPKAAVSTVNGGSGARPGG
jgi:hypothetical protein